MHLESYLFFNGRCEEAIEFYQRALGAEVVMMMRNRESPEKPLPGTLPPDSDDKILHATLTVDGAAFSGGDVLPGAYQRPQGFQIQLNLADVLAAERIFTQLAEGGAVTVPLQETFWARRFGAVVDRFGIPWGINCGEQGAV